MFCIYAETNSPRDEDHHPKNYRDISKPKSLDAGLTYSLVGIFTFAF